MSLIEDLKFFKLDNASVGVQEAFRTAPVAVKVPTELLDWVRAVLCEYINNPKDTYIGDLFVCY